MRLLLRIVLWVVLAGNLPCVAQELKTKNIIIVTLDGFRWQELFLGADSAILFNKEFVKDQHAADQFWDSSPDQRRKKLMPFFWSILKQQGQLYGNRNFNNEVNCSNPHWFSYPGYSELLTGFVDRRIRSNDKIENPNYTVLEFIQQQPGYTHAVAAFATWNVFPFIIREEKTGIPVNAGKEFAEEKISEREALLNELQTLLPTPHGSRFDAFTFYYAFEFLKRKRPRVLFVGFDETDQHGHDGRYDEYLKSAHRTHEMLNRLWNWIQSQEDYKDQTTMLITTDHGRGKGSKNSWKNHGRLAFGSGQTWFAVIGPDTPAMGEMKNSAQYFQNQLAKTMASIAGFDYFNVQPVGEIIHSVISTHVLIRAEQKWLSSDR